RVPAKLSFRHKVLVWDTTTSALSRTQALFPPDRLVRKGDTSFTVVLILKSRDEATVKFDSGEPGYTRTLTITVIDYPEKRVEGTFLVKGETPGFIVFRSGRATDPIVGD